MPDAASREASRCTLNMMEVSLPKRGKMHIHRAVSIHIHCVPRLGFGFMVSTNVRTGNSRVQVDFLMIGND